MLGAGVQQPQTVMNRALAFLELSAYRVIQKEMARVQCEEGDHGAGGVCWNRWEMQDGRLHSEL